MTLPFFLASFWLGLHVGVSFLATLAKFKAPSITRATALEVGSITFHWLHLTEFALLTGLFASLYFSTLQMQLFGVIGGCLLLTFALQSLLIKPLLDKRIEVLLRGRAPRPSPLHLIYGGLELTMLILLLLFCFLSGRSS